MFAEINEGCKNFLFMSFVVVYYRFQCKDMVRSSGLLFKTDLVFIHNVKFINELDYSGIDNFISSSDPKCQSELLLPLGVVVRPS